MRDALAQGWTLDDSIIILLTIAGTWVVVAVLSFIKARLYGYGAIDQLPERASLRRAEYHYQAGDGEQTATPCLPNVLTDALLSSVPW